MNKATSERFEATCTSCIMFETLGSPKTRYLQLMHLVKREVKTTVKLRKTEKSKNIFKTRLQE